MIYDEYQHLKFDLKPNGVLLVTLNRPEVLNATNARLHWELTQIWKTVDEDAATKVERQVRKSAAALLLAPRVGERFDAVVTGAAEKGTWIKLLRPAAEGRVVRGAAGLDVGDRVRVKLVHTDVERGFVDFARIGARGERDAVQP